MIQPKPMTRPKTFTTNLADLNMLYGAVDKAVEADDAYEAHRTWMAYLDYLREYNRERGIPFRTRPA